MNKKILVTAVMILTCQTAYSENVMHVYDPSPVQNISTKKTKTQHYFKYHDDMRGYYPQNRSVSMGCFPYTLKDSLNDISNKFGRPVIVTSGFRRGDSGMHGKCLAADIKIPDVHPKEVYNYVKTLPYIKGTGYYGKNRHVHIDVREGQHVSWIN